jgi:preprotein translocase subunit SecE
LCVVIVGSVVIGLLDLGFLNLMQFLMGLSK